MSTSASAGKKDWSPPLVFAEYQLLWLLGRGGMGEVYLGHDKLLDRPVAIKFISAVAPDDRIKEQYLMEARAAARLQHPNVVTVHRVGEIDGRLYIVAEYVRGQTLELVQKPLPWQQALELGVGLARGLAEAHHRGIIHRDIKPGNVILADSGEIKLLDFGLAKCMERSGSLAIPIGPVEITGDTVAPTIDITDPGQVARVVSQAQDIQVRAGPMPVSLRQYGGRGPVFSQRRSQPRKSPSGDGTKSSGYNRRTAITSSIKGTPMYMAPEVLMGLAASRRSDVYSMGALLFEMCAGVPPHYDVPVDQLQAVVPKRDAPPLGHIAPSVDPRFGAVIDRCLRRNAAERFASGEQLLAALEEILPAAIETVPEGNPYRGLWAFEDDHRALFFGRRGEIGTLLDRLRTDPCVLISAESGIGKTSLCRAGLVPLVRDGLLDASRSWRILCVAVGRQPLRSLLAGLGSLLETSEAELYDRIVADPNTLLDTVRERLPEGVGLLVFVDQLEELVTCPNVEEARLLAMTLGSLLVRTPQLRLLMAVRSDYVGRVGALPGLAEAASRCLYVLRPLGPERLREIVTNPAHAKGVRFETPALVATLVDASAKCDGSLPLLQLTLAELWEARDGSVITQAALEAIGGLAGTLARHADHVIGSMLAERRHVARRLLCTLVAPSGNIRSCSEAKLQELDSAALGVLDVLVRARLVFVRSTPDGAVYELAHPALLDGWPTLRRWLADSEALSTSREGAERLRDSPSKPRALDRSRLRFNVIAGALGLSAAVYGGMTLRTSLLQRQQVAAYVQQGQRELTVARSLQAELMQLTEQALAAFAQQRTEESEQLLGRAHVAAVSADRAYGRASHQLEAALNINGGRTDLRDALADILYERALSAEADHQEGLVEELLQRLALYDSSGQRRQRWSRPAHVTLTSTPEAASVHVTRLTADAQKRWSVVTTWSLGSTPLSRVELEAGPYIFVVSAPGFMPMRHSRIISRATDIEQYLTLAKLTPGP